MKYPNTAIVEVNNKRLQVDFKYVNDDTIEFLYGGVIFTTSYKSIIEIIQKCKHIHADSMVEFANDAQNTDEPWLMWQFSEVGKCDDWRSLPIGKMPCWSNEFIYRRHPCREILNGKVITR